MLCGKHRMGVVSGFVALDCRIKSYTAGAQYFAIIGDESAYMARDG